MGEVLKIGFQILKSKKINIKIFKIKKTIFIIFFFEGYFCDKNFKMVILKNYLVDNALIFLSPL